MKHRSAKIFLATMLGSSSLISASAWAQDASAPDAETSENSSPNEIIVTATRREQRVQDIAATVEVLGGDDLRQSGIVGAAQIEFAVPGLQFGNAGFDGALIGLRGVSSQRGFTGDEAAVAVHIDGVFQPQSAQALARLFDVDRVEVLKGPQGTLYGRNANAGVINIVTTAPGNELGGYGQLSYGSFKTIRGEAAINLPLADNQGLRVAIAGADGNGFIDNILDDRSYGDNKFLAGRLRYRGEFGKVTVNASAQYVSDRSQNDLAVTPARRAAIVRTDRATGFYDTIINLPTRQRRKDGNFALDIDVDLGSVGLKSITGSAVFRNNLLADSSPADEVVPAGDSAGRQKGYSISQEFTLYARDIEQFDWRAGLYYSYSNVKEFRFNDVSTSPSPGFNFYDDLALSQTGNAYAVYADLGWNLSGALKLTVGARYNWEDKSQTQAEVFGLFAPAPGVVPNCSAVAIGSFDTCFSSDSRSKSWKGLTARAGLDWKVTDDNLLYANYGRGFRSGAIGGIIAVDNWGDRAFGGTGTLRLSPLNPEKVDAFELGTKNSFADGLVIVNASLFYTIFKDQLFTANDPTQNFRVIEGNLGKSKIKGADLFVAIRPADGLQFSINNEFLSAKIDSLDAIVAPDIVVDNRLPRAPKYSMAAAADWNIPVAEGSLSLRAEYNYKSSHFLNLQNTLRQKGVELVNLSARFESGDDKGWFLFGNLRNLFGEKYLVAGGIPTTAGPRFIGTARPGEPFTFEVGAGFRF
jgi:iron complex outermembrane recepter protein